jgi:hypothetical protein
VEEEEAPRVSSQQVPIQVFHSIAISCEECRIQIWMKELSIRLVHGVATWETFLTSDEVAEPVQDALVASDTEDEALVLQIFRSMVSMLSGTGEPSSDISWHSMEIEIDKVQLTYAVDGAEVISGVVSGLTIHCRNRVDDNACIIKAPEFILSREADLPFAEFASATISFDSTAAVRPCFRCLLSFLDWLGIAVRIPTLTASTTDGWASGIWTDITRTATGAGACAHLAMSYVDGTTLALSGISFDSTGQCRVAAVDTLYIPGICSLSRKAVAVQFSVAEKTVVNLSAAHIILLRNLARESPGLSWPCFPWLEVLIDEIVVEYQGKMVLEMQRCCLTGRGSEKGLAFSICCDFLESRMISTITSSISGCFISKDVLSDLVIRPGAMSMIADLRTFDWSLIRLTDDDSAYKRVLNIPRGIIESFALSVDLNAMLSTEKPHVFPSFQGGPNATTDDFGEYVVKLCVKELPKLYAKTRVMGERATDLTAKAAGRLISSSVVSSAIGSIGALILTDAVRVFSKLNVLDYLLSMKRAAQGDADIDDDDGQSHTENNVLVRLKRYTANNRTRFGSAAGSAFGIAIGTALYGLPGMMLGNMLGGKIFAAAIGQPSSATGVMGSITLKEDTTNEWVLVDFHVPPTEIDAKVQDEADLKHVPARRVVYARHDRACPSAPVSLTCPACPIQGQHTGDGAVPSHLLPTSRIDTSEGYLAALQQTFFVFVRRHQKESQWHGKAT